MNFGRLQAVYNKYFDYILDIKPGMLLEVHEEVGEGDNKRVWKFKGLVIKTWNAGHPDGTFTMRGVSSGVVVEKIYPFAFPKFAKVLLMDEYKVRRSKLYYIRDKVGKAARMKSIISSERRGMDLLKKAKEQVVAKQEVVKDAPKVEAAPEAVADAPNTEEKKTD